MKNFTFPLLIVLILASFNFAQSNPKREMRGVWVASVTNLDWPSKQGMTVTEQKQELINYFDNFQAVGINAVFFQIRTECDALYDSPYEPWSYWLTGKQGQAPSEPFDPLKFAIQEAHKRGMELHAWFNPYRAEKEIGYYPVSSTHITQTHPDWILTIGTYKFLNPGLPEVRAYVEKVFMDVVRRYDIDGVHMDDYFYSYDPISTQDTAAFRIYNRGISNIGDWRRDNVNLLVKEIQDSVNSVKPYLKYGISPFGIWKPNVPSGISGFDAYNILYCDPIHWLQKGIVDYITPQLYWPFGGGQDYAKLLKWWADSAGANNRHMYVGQAAYKVYSYSASELPNEIAANRKEPNCQGSVFFEAIDFRNNPKGFVDSLAYHYYTNPAIPPLMNWKEQLQPNSPSNLKIITDVNTGKKVLSWDKPTAATDGDTAVRYAVYRFDHSPSQSEIDNGNNLIAICGTSIMQPLEGHYLGTSGNYFIVTALDKNNNESTVSNVIQVPEVPSIPQINTPPDNNMNQKDTVLLKWSGDQYSGSYSIQVSTDSTFTSNMIVNLPEIKDSTYTLTSLLALTKYYWRVKSLGFGGESNYSNIYRFSTAFPLPPELADPPHATTLTVHPPTLKWFVNTLATSYTLQVGVGAKMYDKDIILDTTLTDTLLTIENLSLNTIYYWRVKSLNQYGESGWSSIWGFKTASTVDVKENVIDLPKSYALQQNFPNPFNPVTQIKYQIPKSSFVTLKIYNILGREIATLVNEERSAGYYSATFNAVNLPSGIYFYKLQAGNYSSVKKLVLLK